MLTVGLNRPAKRNALNDGIILAIQDCFANLPDTIGAVVIHGIGDHFSSGLDLSELTEQDATDGLRHSQMWHRVFDRIQYSRVPVIAALKGAVIGGGLEWPARCIFVLTNPAPHSGAALWRARHFRWRRRIGAVAAADWRRPDDRLGADGHTESATEGASYGFAQYLTEQGQALPKAMELAAKVASNAPLTNFVRLQALPMIAEANPQTGSYPWNP